MNPPKNPRKDLTLSDKRKIISLFDEEYTHQQIAITFGCDRSTVTKILQNRSKIESHGNDATRRRIKGCKSGELEAALAEWIRLKRSLKQTIPSVLVKEQAQSLAESLQITSLKFSDGWLSNFFQRHGFSNVYLHGEGGSVNEEQVMVERAKLQVKLRNYSPHDVYNADETGLYYRLLPRRSVVLEAEAKSIRGTKLIKDRLTILLCCNATGTSKLVPLAIGHSANPRCLKGNTQLPVQYYSSKTGWMNHEIMSLFIKSLDDIVKRPSILLLDNFSSHEKALEGLQLQKLTVEFLPPNTTSCLQPLDCGIIESFKAHYRRNLARKVLHENDMDLKGINLMHAFMMISNAWSHVTPLTIGNCWLKAGIVSRLRASTENYDDPIQSELAETLTAFGASLTSSEINRVDDLMDSALSVPSAVEILEEHAAADQDATEDNESNGHDSIDARIVSKCNKYLSEPCDIAKCCDCLEYISCFQFQNANLYTMEERTFLYDLMDKTRDVKRRQSSRQLRITDFAKPDDEDVFIG
jgi:hypothetical protein